jgi:hypothetical protein
MKPSSVHAKAWNPAAAMEHRKIDTRHVIVSQHRSRVDKPVFKEENNALPSECVMICHSQLLQAPPRADR